MVAFLLEVGAQVDGSDERGTTPLMIAAGRGNLSIVKMLLECEFNFLKPSRTLLP